MENLDVTVLRALRDWRGAGKRALLATVVRTWGSSPRPTGSIMAEIPVLAARATGRPSSMARTRAINRCCIGPAQGPNHESSVTFTSHPGR